MDIIYEKNFVLWDYGGFRLALLCMKKYNTIIILSLYPTSSCHQGLQVSFTLVNSDPDSVLAEWDIEPAVKSKQKPNYHLITFA